MKLAHMTRSTFNIDTKKGNFMKMLNYLTLNDIWLINGQIPSIP